MIVHLERDYTNLVSSLQIIDGDVESPFSSIMWRTPFRRIKLQRVEGHNEEFIVTVDLIKKSRVLITQPEGKITVVRETTVYEVQNLLPNLEPTLMFYSKKEYWKSVI